MTSSREADFDGEIFIDTMINKILYFQLVIFSHSILDTQCVSFDSLSFVITRNKRFKGNVPHRDWSTFYLKDNYMKLRESKETHCIYLEVKRTYVFFYVNSTIDLSKSRKHKIDIYIYVLFTANVHDIVESIECLWS